MSLPRSCCEGLWLSPGVLWLSSTLSDLLILGKASGYSVKQPCRGNRMTEEAAGPLSSVRSPVRELRSGSLPT